MEGAILHCRSYALRAERKMGEMLKTAANNKTRATRGGDRKSKSHEGILIPTLADYSLSLKESAEAQLLAEMPADDFEVVPLNRGPW